MGIDTYLDQDESVQKQTHITMANPNHPDTTASYADDETIHAHFQAAKSIQSSGINRKQIVGDFLVAVNAAVNGGNPEALDEFFEELTGESEE